MRSVLTGGAANKVHATQNKPNLLDVLTVRLTVNVAEEIEKHSHIST